MQKWIAIALIAAGLVPLAVALKRDKKSSFDDGSFLAEIGALLLGGGLIAAGVIWLFALAFLKL